MFPAASSLGDDVLPCIFRRQEKNRLFHRTMLEYSSESSFWLEKYGVEQENGFPIDLHKGAFVATVPIQEAGLEEELQKIGPEIARIVYEDLAESRHTPGMPSFADQG